MLILMFEHCNPAKFIGFFEQLLFCLLADDTLVSADTFLSIQSRFEALRGSRKADFPDETTECHFQFLPELMVRTLCWSYRAPFLMRPGSGRTPWMISRWVDRPLGAPYNQGKFEPAAALISTAKSEGLPPSVRPSGRNQ